MNKTNFKKAAAGLLCMVMLAVSTYGCTPTKVDSAKKILSEARKYVTMAETLVALAELEVYHYCDKMPENIAKQIEATRESLGILKDVIKATEQSLEKDYINVATSMALLIRRVVKLVDLVEELKGSGISC